MSTAIGRLVLVEQHAMGVDGRCAHEALEGRRVDRAADRAFEQRPRGEQVGLQLDGGLDGAVGDRGAHLSGWHRLDGAVGEAVGVEQLHARVEQQGAGGEREHREHGACGRREAASRWRAHRRQSYSGEQRRGR